MELNTIPDYPVVLIDDKYSTYYFENGVLVRIDKSKYDNPHRYGARYIVSDGIKYDMFKYNDILNMPMPNYHKSKENNNVTRAFDYLLRMVASYIREKSHFLSDVILLKTTAFMLNGNIQWQEKDYYRLGEWLAEDYMFQASDLYIKKINKSNKIKRLPINIIPIILFSIRKTHMFRYVIKIDHKSKIVYFFKTLKEELKARKVRIDNINSYRNSLESKKEYYQLKQKYPEIITKSYYSYCRIKSNNGNTWKNLNDELKNAIPVEITDTSEQEETFLKLIKKFL